MTDKPAPACPLCTSIASPGRTIRSRLRIRALGHPTGSLIATQGGLAGVTNCRAPVTETGRLALLEVGLLARFLAGLGRRLPRGRRSGRFQGDGLAVVGRRSRCGSFRPGWWRHGDDGRSLGNRRTPPVASVRRWLRCDHCRFALDSSRCARSVLHVGFIPEIISEIGEFLVRRRFHASAAETTATAETAAAKAAARREETTNQEAPETLILTQ